MEFVKKDDSFFSVKYLSPSGLVNELENVSDYVIGLNIREESGKSITGSIRFRDENKDGLGIISAVLTAGMPLEITWGYKKWSQPIVYNQDPSEIGGIIQRSTQVVLVQPSGGGGESGDLTYNAQFFEAFTRGNKLIRYFDTGTRAQVIKQLFSELKITLSEIYFGTMNISCVSNPIRQNGTSAKILLDLATQWRCYFRIASTPKGQVGIFVDPEKAPFSKFISYLTGASGNFRSLDYKVDRANVRSFTWKQNYGENGSGDRVYIYTDSQGIGHMVSTPIPGQSVVVYKLNAAAIQSELSKAINRGRESEFVASMLQKNKFSDVIRFFTKDTEQTAPDGIGLEASCVMQGDPLLSPPLRVLPGANFPVQFQDKSQVFYVRSAEHNIGENYETNIELGNTWAINGTGLDTSVVDTIPRG